MVLSVTFLLLRIPKKYLPREFSFMKLVLNPNGCNFHTSTSVYDTASAARCSKRDATVSIINFKTQFQVLQEIYNFSRADQKTLLETTPNLSNCDINQLWVTASYLKNEGVQKNTIVLVPWILMYTSDDLSYALSCIKKCHEDVNISAPLLKLPLNKLRIVSFIATQDASKLTERNRINMIAKALECDPFVVAQSVVKYHFMLTMSLERLSEILKLLADFEVPGDSILKDGWVFKYRPETISMRLNRAKEAGIKSPRTWFVRCREDTFKRMISKRTEAADLLRKHSSVQGYLRDRLHCGDSMLLFIGLRTPQILRASVPKLRQMLDFLYDNGYTPAQVCQVPRVLTRSVKTVAARQQQLLALGFQPWPVPLLVLCKSRRQYEELVARLKHQRGV